MVLVDHQIKAAIQNEVLRIEPYNPDLINPNSMDVTLSNRFKYYKGFEKTSINLYDERSINLGLTERSGPIVIHPGQFMLASTVETVSLPDNLCAELNGKSSLARVGLQIHQTGGWVDCQFSGEITLELYNSGTRPIELIPGMPIGQLVFHQTEPATEGYGSRKGSKYQNQKGVTASRYYLNQSLGSITNG